MIKETCNNNEAEQRVLAGLCKGIYELNEIDIHDFHDTKHRAIFKRIEKLKNQIPHLDAEIIYNEFEKERKSLGVD